MSKVKNLLSFLVVSSLVFTVLPFQQVFAQEDSHFDEIEQLIDELIYTETQYGLSGAQLVVMKDGIIIKDSSYGYINNYKNVYRENGRVILNQIELLPQSERIPVNSDTMFDLASITKMYTVVYALQKLVSDGVVQLDTPVVDIFPEYHHAAYGVDDKSSVTIGMLLNHSAGYVEDPHYFNEWYDANEGSEVGENHLYTRDSETTQEKLMMTPLEREPGTSALYSDVDFMLLGNIIEELTGMGLDEYMSKEFYNPLGLKHITFNPLKNGYDVNDTAATELHGNTRDGSVRFQRDRKRIIHGQADDEAAYYSMDGVAGHAGLFSSAKDLAVLSNIMLDGGYYNNLQFFTQDTIDTFTQASELDNSFGFGWRTNQNYSYSGVYSGYASMETFGHTGWTSTMSLIDPENNLVVVLLTNAKNSPIMGIDSSAFYTRYLHTSGYSTIVGLVYESLGIGFGESAGSYLIDKIDYEYEPEYLDNPSSRNALRALIDVAYKLSSNDDDLQAYIESAQFKEMEQFLEGTRVSDTRYALISENE